ncbi:hypothetical protein MLD38_040379 [Melastoma candidum]|uniref:Uncharacterized protein n=1 Tax=Melastoma candidum TaxID=119954 RepID=A0ACB9L5J5_9MYRT|nr:hypothetical protein MLD38_040379 [Melastoma candidum]
MEDEDCCSWDGITCDNSTGDVIGLDLTGAGLQGILPTEISQLLKLVSLDLPCNSELEMQDHTMRMLVSNLPQLEELNLEYVNLSTVNPTTFIPSSFQIVCGEGNFLNLSLGCQIYK